MDKKPNLDSDRPNALHLALEEYKERRRERIASAILFMAFGGIITVALVWAGFFFSL